MIDKLTNRDFRIWRFQFLYFHVYRFFPSIHFNFLSVMAAAFIILRMVWISKFALLTKDPHYTVISSDAPVRNLYCFFTPEKHKVRPVYRPAKHSRIPHSHFIGYPGFLTFFNEKTGFDYRTKQTGKGSMVKLIPVQYPFYFSAPFHEIVADICI